MKKYAIFYPDILQRRKLFQAFGSTVQTARPRLKPERQITRKAREQTAVKARIEENKLLLERNIRKLRMKPDQILLDKSKYRKENQEIHIILKSQPKKVLVGKILALTFIRKSEYILQCYRTRMTQKWRREVWKNLKRVKLRKKKRRTKERRRK